MTKELHNVVAIFSVVYLIGVSIYLIFHGMWFSPDQFFAAAIVAALFLGRLRQFFRDWLPPIILLLGYEAFHRIIPDLSSRAHAMAMIRFDQTLFGSVPTVFLQQHLFNGSFFQWYDYIAVLLYESHFIAFMLVAFGLWLTKREDFRRFFLAILLLSYSAFITYAIFPAVPPWMASNRGILPPLTDILGQVSVGFPKPLSLPTLYQFFGANLVAAVPSLHAAYPWLIFLFLFRKFRLWSLAVLPYVFGVWFSTVYLAQHYVFDILIGCIYASAAFVLTSRVPWEKVRLNLRSGYVQLTQGFLKPLDH